MIRLTQITEIKLKKTVYILGDSMIEKLKGYLLTKKN